MLTQEISIDRGHPDRLRTDADAEILQHVRKPCI